MISMGQEEKKKTTSFKNTFETQYSLRMDYSNEMLCPARWGIPRSLTGFFPFFFDFWRFARRLKGRGEEGNASNGESPFPALDRSIFISRARGRSETSWMGAGFPRRFGDSP